MKDKKMISLFAGVGGLDLGFEQAGGFTTVYANELDEKAQTTYHANNPGVLLDGSDICTVDTAKLPDADIVLSGFPCQPFSIAGYRKGFEDKRGNLFFETLRVIEHVQPEAFLLENVKNLVSHDKGNTFKVIQEYLTEAGYYFKYQVLNTKKYGNIPQNRDRIYIVGFKDADKCDNFKFPDELALTTKLSDIIDFESQVDDKYYYTKDSVKYYDKLAEGITKTETIYQWRRAYVRENKSGVVPTLTANMGTGGGNVPLIKTYSGMIRKLTPRETFNTQGYPANFILPTELANSALYKQAGNSVSVPVIKRIAEQVKLVLD